MIEVYLVAGVWMLVVALAWWLFIGAEWSVKRNRR